MVPEPIVDVMVSSKPNGGTKSVHGHSTGTTVVNERLLTMLDMGKRGPEKRCRHQFRDAISIESNARPGLFASRTFERLVSVY